MLTTSAGSRASIHSSKSAVSIRVLPSLRRVSRRCAPNGIFSVDSTSSSEPSSLYSSSSDLSTTSEEDEWSDDDFEDPLWVKDDNLRRSRRARQHQPTPHPPPPEASTLSLASSSSALVDQPRTISDDNMVLEEDDGVVEMEPEPLLATKETRVEEAGLTPRKRARGRTPGKTEQQEEEDRGKNKKVNKVKKRREQQTAAYREFAMQLDTSALDDLTSTTTTSTRLAQRRGKAFSVNLTPRGGLSSPSSSSSSSSPSSTAPAKISPQQRERERRKMEREVMTQRQQHLAQPQTHQHRVPPLSIPPAATTNAKKMEGNFWRKKMRGVKAYFSSSSSSSPPVSPGAPRSTSYSPPPTPTFTPLS